MVSTSAATRVAAVLLLAVCTTFATGKPAPAQAASAGVMPDGQAGSTAQDEGLKRIFIAQPSTNKVYVVDSASMLLLGVLRVPVRPSAMVTDPKRHLVYVASDEAGIITEFSAKTLKQLHRKPVGGRPGGLTLLDNGRTLLIADQATGTISRLTVQPKILAPERALAMGPGPNPTAMLSPPAAPYGSKAMVWGQNFGPGEPVEVLWGMVNVAMLKADELGAVTGTFTVPHKSDLGLHLVILVGQASKHAQSGLLNVLKPPPPRVLPAKPQPKPKSALALRVEKLFASRVSVQAPKLIAIGPLKNRALAVPTMYLVLVYIAITLIVLVRRRGRRRRAPAKSRGKKSEPVLPGAAMRTGAAA